MVKSLDNMTLAELKTECSRKKYPSKDCRKNKADLLKYMKSKDRASAKKVEPRESKEKSLESMTSVELKNLCVSSNKATKSECAKMKKAELIKLINSKKSLVKHKRYTRLELDLMDIDNLKTKCKLEKPASECNDMSRDQLMKLLEYTAITQKIWDFLPTLTVTREQLLEMKVDDLRVFCRVAGVPENKCAKMNKSQLIEVRLKYQEKY